MSTGEIENIYRDAGALLEGHFLLSSGNHSRFYLQSARVLENPSTAEYLARKLAQQIRDYFLVGASPGDSGMYRVGLASADSCVAKFAGERSMQSPPLPAIGAVCSPAIGGILAGYELARSLGVRFVFTERVNGTMTLRRGFCIGERENVLICEDIVTTGGSAMEAAECVRRLGGNVVCIAAIASRGFAKRVGSSLESRPESKLPPDIPFFALADFIFDMFSPSECELCRTSVAYKPGSRTP